MKVPNDIRQPLIDQLWLEADRMGWIGLSDREKGACYESWVLDDRVGGVLTRFMDKGAVRVYIKDSLMKPYTRDRLASGDRPLRMLGLTLDGLENERFIKPHGVRLQDGSVACWGRADDWKAIVLACFERAQTKPGSRARGAVLFAAGGRFREPTVRRLVEDVARRLDVEELIWDELSM